MAINYRSREDEAQDTVWRVEEAGGQAFLVPFDVSDAAAVEAGVKDVVDRGGQLDILVNNAAVAVDNLLMRMKLEQWQGSLDTNLTSVFAACKAASRSLLKAKDAGRIINITSVVGEMGNAGQVAYVAAKAGVIGVTKTLARELASRGVTVNAVSPGFIETDMTAASVTDSARQELLGRIPLGRMGKPEDVAQAVAFLAGPEAAYITGQVIRVNGGLLL